LPVVSTQRFRLPTLPLSRGVPEMLSCIA
jgi:hypothetical protein